MEIVLRAAAVFFTLLLLVRVMGKKELSGLSAFELVLLVTVGDVVQQGVTQEDMSLTGAVLAGGTLGLLVVALSYIQFRWSRVRPALQGSPVLVVQDGRLLEDIARIERLSLEEVLEAARQQGMGSLSQIRFGILEADGRFSFVPQESETSRSPESHEG